MSELKYFYTCKNYHCSIEWVDLGVNYIYCKHSKKYTRPEDSCYECKKNKNPITSYSYCNYCYSSPSKKNMIQGFLYSNFFCDDCEYEQSVDGLQEFSNESCDCGLRLVNYDYKNEYYLLTLENEEKSVLSEIKKKYGTTLKKKVEYFRKYFGKFSCETENIF